MVKLSTLWQLGLYVEMNLLEFNLVLHTQKKNVKLFVPVIPLVGTYSCEVSRDGTRIYF